MPRRQCVTLYIYMVTKCRDNPRRKWIAVLEIPTNELPRFSLRPFKWLRFLAFCVTGVQGRIALSCDVASPTVDYNTPVVTEKVKVYYHLPPGTHAQVFPIDPDLAKSSVHTERSQREGRFRDQLIIRDKSCAMSGDEDTEGLDGAHCISFSKGSEVSSSFLNVILKLCFLTVFLQYLKTYTSNRGNVVIEEINDVRNGLLVAKTLHHRVGKRTAFLPVRIHPVGRNCMRSYFIQIPNFAMEAGDVATQVRQLRPGQRVQTQDARQWIIQHFGANSSVLPLIAPHGAPLFVPAPRYISKWPPESLFCAIYGGTAMRQWLVSGFADIARKVYTDRLYPSDTQNSRDGRRQQIKKKRRNDEKKAEQSAVRQKRRE